MRLAPDRGGDPRREGSVFVALALQRDLVAAGRKDGLTKSANSSPPYCPRRRANPVYSVRNMLGKLNASFAAPMCCRRSIGKNDSRGTAE